MRPPNTPPAPQVNIDLSKATDIVCDRCGNATFQEVVLMKHLSAIVSPTGKAGNVPIPTFACVACGWVNDGFLPPILKKNETPTGKIDSNGVVQSTLEAPTPEKPRLELVTK